MRYIDLINNFWRVDEQKSFNGNTTRLYFFLLYLANRSYWASDWLEYADTKMRVNLGVSAEVLRTARDKLKEASLINYIPGGDGQGVKTRYQILTPKSNPNPQPNFDPNLNLNLNPHPEPLYNKNNTKTKTKNHNGKYSQREYIIGGSDFD